MVKANDVHRKSKGTTTQQNGSNNRNQTNKGSQIFGGTGQKPSVAATSKNNQIPSQCY